jgi:Lactonase, 7-bladed beta-propeller
LRYASTGTRYFASNSSIFQVGADGLITAVATGSGSVTVIQGGIEEVIPVRVELPHIGSTILGRDGGVVQSTDGATVLLGQGALKQDTPVTIEQVRQENLPVAMPENFDFVGAFRLDVGNSELGIPAQIAVPAPAGLAVGKEVFFMRQEMLPDSTGIMRPVWLVEESGIVGTDGFIRTQSPPWTGAKNTGLYTIAVPKFEYKVFVMPLPAEARFAVGLAFMGFGLLSISTTPLALFAINSGALILASSQLDDYSTYRELQVDVLTIPQTTLFSKVTKTNVSLNLSQLNSQNPTPPVAYVDTTSFGNSNYSPNIQGARVGFDEEGAYISVGGSNFSSSTDPNVNNPNDKLSVELSFGNQTYIQKDVKLETDGAGAQRLIFRVPDSLPISGQLNITVLRTVGSQTASAAQHESQTVPVLLNYFDRVVAANPLSGKVQIFNSNRTREVVARDGSANLLLASISLGENSVPRYLAALEDRIYVPLEGEGKVAVIDAIGLRELDTNAATAQIDRIDLKQPGARPSYIVLGNSNRTAYISDRVNDSIYILDIDPNSEKTYNQVVKVLHVKGANSIHRMALNSSGQFLFVTASTTDGKGQIAIIDVNTNEFVGSPIFTEDGVEGIASTDEENVMLFTNRKQEAQGLGRLTLEISANGVPSENGIEYVQMLLGSTNDAFDLTG